MVDLKKKWNYPSNTSTVLPEEIYEALRALRAAHGDSWRNYLITAWLTREPITGVSDDQALILTRLRGKRRPPWVMAIDLDNHK
jgi:hypothetical protein